MTTIQMSIKTLAPIAILFFAGCAARPSDGGVCADGYILDNSGASLLYTPTQGEIDNFRSLVEAGEIVCVHKKPSSALVYILRTSNSYWEYIEILDDGSSALVIDRGLVTR